MARIIYKEGLEGQNRLDCIEGIEIELLNGQSKSVELPAKRKIRTLILIARILTTGVVAINPH